MKLFFAPDACSLVPHILLRETGQPVELVKVDTSAHKTESGDDYYALNPKGYVPLIEIGLGEYLTEGPVIAQYIADQAGREDLMPRAGSKQRYRVMEWQNYIAAELHMTYMPLFNASLEQSSREYFLSALRHKFEWVSSQLRDRQYLTGPDFTAADAYLYVLTRWSKYVALDISDLCDLQAFVKRVSQRPAVRHALHAEVSRTDSRYPVEGHACWNVLRDVHHYA